MVSGREAAARMQADSRLTRLDGALCTDEFCVAVRKGDTQFSNAINATIKKRSPMARWKKSCKGICGKAHDMHPKS